MEVLQPVERFSIKPAAELLNFRLMMTAESVESSILTNLNNPKECRQSLRLKFRSINLPGESILIFQLPAYIYCCLPCIHCTAFE